ncbi:MAG: DAK2 domain-containing protein [Clostridia bacterium]|nr:DAK2 domain-containing protein [Clostridia bacterium]
MLKNINGATLKKMIIAGASFVEESKQAIDILNVYPVMDADTGTNMFLTLKSTATEVNNCATNSLEDVSQAIARGALKGARGNSGVILSQVLKGISTVVGQTENVTTKVFAKALKEGSEIAYKAVTKPQEGTMLTIIRALAESAQSISKKVSDFDEFFELILKDGEEVLQKTPEMLPVLKKAGVIDAGGRGLIVFFTGCWKALSDDTTFEYSFDDNVGMDANEAFHASLDVMEEIEFAYCTEFKVIQMKPKTTESDIDKLREKLLQLGDCVICVGDLTMVKVHVHTNEPNKALGYALEMGELYDLKIENMVEQNRVVRNKSTITQKQLKPFGMVAVSPGDGISEVFDELQCDYIIRGGQTMNPSANDIAKAVMSVDAKDIFIFPNNKNIILAAEQAQDLVKNRVIHVIPTRSIPEGIASCLAFNPDATLEDNLFALKASFEKVKSGSVTYAVKNIEIDGFELEAGEIIGLNNKKIVAKSKDIEDATIQLVDKLVDDESINITLFYGDKIEESEAESVKEKLESKYPLCDVNIINGGQPIYYYLVSVE